MERLEDTLRRLAKEREEADRRYNDALTAVDRAHPDGARVPRPIRGFDEHQLKALNEAWNIIPEAPVASGVKARLVGFVWHIMAPYLQRQLTFNSLLVDHVNRTTASARESYRASEELASALEARLVALHQFTARLLVYLQQITAYIDTKDREVASGTLIVNAALSGAVDNLEKRWESLQARLDALNSRLDAAAASLASADEDLRTSLRVAQQAVHAFKREAERLAVQPAAGTGTPAPAAVPPDAAFATALDSFKYVGFEDIFRGSRETIRARFASYVPLFAGAQDVLDAGCGRGEFLELLRDAGIGARGIDLNHEMAELCRSRGLDVAQADAVGYLSGLPDVSLGGLFCAQVVEHLEPAYLLRFLELAFNKLKPGAVMVVETLNPACWVAFFDSYLRDITHRWPLHPDTLKYLVLASGFTQVQIDYRSPVADEHKLQMLSEPSTVNPAARELVEKFNENVVKLNSRLFTHLDYAVIAKR
jgi:SAM-dependent methyltransferase